MLVVTTENVPGHRVREAKGQVFGVAVRGRGQTTGERFVDPHGGASVEVLYDPASGERRYESSKAPGSQS